MVQSSSIDGQTTEMLIGVFRRRTSGIGAEEAKNTHVTATQTAYGLFFFQGFTRTDSPVTYNRSESDCQVSSQFFGWNPKIEFLTFGPGGHVEKIRQTLLPVSLTPWIAGLLSFS